MRFLVDENIPPDCVRQLRKANHDVISILEAGMGTPDESVMSAARQHNRILVTFDSDFGRLIYAKQKPPPPRVIFLRFEPVIPEEVSRALLDLIDTENIEGNYTTVVRNGVRQRPLPRT